MNASVGILGSILAIGIDTTSVAASAGMEAGELDLFGIDAIERRRVKSSHARRDDDAAGCDSLAT